MAVGVAFVGKATAAQIKGFDAVLVLANPIYYFRAGKRLPSKPMNFWKVFELVFLEATSAGLDEVDLGLLDESEAVLIDPWRLRIVETVLERTDDVPRLRRVDRADPGRWPRLYTIDRSRGATE